MNSCMSGMSSAQLKGFWLLICWLLLAGGDFCSETKDLLRAGKHWWPLQMLRKEQHTRSMFTLHSSLLPQIVFSKNIDSLSHISNARDSISSHF